MIPTTLTAPVLLALLASCSVLSQPAADPQMFGIPGPDRASAPATGGNEATSVSRAELEQQLWQDCTVDDLQASGIRTWPSEGPTVVIGGHCRSLFGAATPENVGTVAGPARDP